MNIEVKKLIKGVFLDLNINDVFQKLDIKSSDTIVIHGDAGIAFQLKEIDIENRLRYFLQKLIDFIDEKGTLIIPAFSYSFTKGESFDVNNTPSDVGQFSEAFRLLPRVFRSKNPNFSVCSVGKYAKEFSNSSIYDCFGSETAFDLMYKYNAKLVCLGCEFNRITFVHYLEQKIGVPYRYLKTFSGTIIDNEEIINIDNTYYVRDLSINSEAELTAVKYLAEKRGLLLVEKFGRLPVFAISSKHFYVTAKEILSENAYGLIQQRFNKTQ